MAITTTTTKGQIVIPSKIRKRFNIKKGTKIFIDEKEEEIILKPVTTDYLGKIAGVLKTEGKLSRKLLEERAAEKRKEYKL